MTSPTPPAGPPSGDPSAQPGPSGAPSGPQGGNEPPAGGPAPSGPQNGGQGGNEPQNGGNGDDRPPWEREGVAFDPESAWRLIQNAREGERQAKTNAAERQTKLDEIERGNMTEAQQTAADRDSYKSRAESAEWELARYEVIGEKGLKPGAVRWLTGTNREELATSADALLAEFGDAVRAGAGPAPSGNTPPSSRPTERLSAPPSGGGDPSSTPVELDPDKLAAAIPRRF